MCANDSSNITAYNYTYTDGVKSSVMLAALILIPLYESPVLYNYNMLVALLLVYNHCYISSTRNMMT